VFGLAGCFSGMNETRGDGRSRDWDMVKRWGISGVTSRGRDRQVSPSAA
jgi:hypothetical protein